MSEIKLAKRYPQSRTEDITDAFMRGYEEGRKAESIWREKVEAAFADCKTENSSEKPNNCKTCRNWDIVNDHCYFIQECHYEPQYDIDKGTIRCVNCSEYGSFKCTKCDGEMYFKRLEPKTEPRTEDLQDWKDRMWAEAVIEPQTEYQRGIDYAWSVAQKVFNSTVTFYEAEDVAKQMTDCSKCETYWNCQGQCDEIPQIEDEPQTERPRRDAAYIMDRIDLDKKVAEAVKRNKEEQQTDCQWK